MSYIKCVTCSQYLTTCRCSLTEGFIKCCECKEQELSLSINRAYCKQCISPYLHKEKDVCITNGCHGENKRYELFCELCMLRRKTINVHALEKKVDFIIEQIQEIRDDLVFAPGGAMPLAAEARFNSRPTQ